MVEQPSGDKFPSTLRLAGGRREGMPGPGFPGSGTLGIELTHSQTLKLVKCESRRRKGRQRMRRLDSITDSMDRSLSKLREIVKDREAWHAAVPGSQRVRKESATEQVNSLIYTQYIRL